MIGRRTLLYPLIRFCISSWVNLLSGRFPRRCVSSRASPTPSPPLCGVPCKTSFRVTAVPAFPPKGNSFGLSSDVEIGFGPASPWRFHTWRAATSEGAALGGSKGSDTLRCAAEAVSEFEAEAEGGVDVGAIDVEV